MNTSSLPWPLLAAFSACAEHGSLSAAARMTGQSQPTVSRHIAELEGLVGGKLFDRSRNGLHPTTLGLELVEPAKMMADAAALASARMSGQQSERKATVRLTASKVMATFMLPAVLADFQVEYPHIQIELVANDRSDNLLRREADIALRMFRPTQDDLIARHLGDIELAVLTSQLYIDRYGAPTSIRDLRNHRLIGQDQETRFIESLQEYGLDVGVEDFDLRCDDQAAYLYLIANGGGIGFGQARTAARIPGIITIPADVPLPKLPMWLTAHQALKNNRAVRALYDFLAERLSNPAA